MGEHWNPYNILLYDIILIAWVQLDFLLEIALIFCEKIAFAAFSAMELYNNNPVNVFWAVKYLGDLKLGILEPFPLYLPVCLIPQYVLIPIIRNLEFLYCVNSNISNQGCVGYKDGVLLNKLILYLHKLIIALNGDNLIRYLKLPVRLFPAFNAYGNSLEALVMRSFQYLQCRMRSYCCYLIIFWRNHIRGEYMGYLKVSVKISNISKVVKMKKFKYGSILLYNKWRKHHRN